MLRKTKTRTQTVPTSTILTVALLSMFGCLQIYYSTLDTVQTSSLAAPDNGSPPLLTLGEMKRTMKLPCNYIHDGFFVPHSNEMTNQIYQSLMTLDDDDIVPVVIEVGAHDGITKSMSLKASMCLQANVLLIEASPANYRVLEQARSYDTTVNAALCSGKYAAMEESDMNSGQSHLLSSGDSSSGDTRTVNVPCTTLDAELDKLKARLPRRLQSKLRLVFLVLDVEGFEATAMEGLKRYSPEKAYVEWTRVSEKEDKAMMKWAAGHNLHGDYCGPLKRDKCFNWDPTLFFGNKEKEALPWMRDVFYGARKEVPEHTATTSKVSGSYMFYGQ